MLQAGATGSNILTAVSPRLSAGAWSVPQPLFQTTACPPHNAGIQSDAMYTIGRTMFETDRLTPEHAARCNAMDEVWVPTAFLKVRSCSPCCSQVVLVLPFRLIVIKSWRTRALLPQCSKFIPHCPSSPLV